MKKIVALLVALSLPGYASTLADTLSLNPRVFRCEPSVVSPSDTLVLRKSSPELTELAVLRPGSHTPHFLVVGLPPDEMKPLMSPEQLGASTEVRMPVRQLTGLEWRIGAAQEPVFTVPGIYRFILSRNLESEEIAYTCEVEFQLHRKPANNSFKH